MKVGIVVREGRANPAARVRALQYLPNFERAGDETRVLAWRANSRSAVAIDTIDIMRLARWADVLLLQRPNQPRSVLRRVAERNPRIVVDFDDALWVGPPSYRERLIAAIQIAAVTTPGSNFLAAWARKWTAPERVCVIRPSVDVKRHDIHQHAASTCTLGWIGTAGNLRDISSEVLAAIRLSFSTAPEVDWAYRTISSENLENPPPASEFIPWSEQSEATALLSLDVGLMPLADDERSRGRCGFKAIQYLAAGVPTIASPLGAGLEIVEHNVTGLLAQSADEWREAILRLGRSAQLRAEMGAAGRDWVAANASTEVSFTRLRECLVRAGS